MEFVVSDESVNRDGYRTLTDGIKLENFLKNPVMHFNHTWGRVPIGRWENLRKEDGKLIAAPVFNEKDPFALQIKEAVEGGFINATSIGAEPLLFSNDPQHLMENQRAETLVESDLFEISFTDLPSNTNAVRLSFENKYSEVPKLKLKKKQKKVLKMEAIALSLGLKKDATEVEILAAIRSVGKEDSNDQKVNVLIALGVANGHINDSNKEHFTTLAKTNYDTVFDMVGVPKAVEAAPSGEGGKEGEDAITLSKLIAEVKKIGKSDDGEAAEDEAAEFLRLSKENPSALAEMEIKDNPKFIKLNKAYIASFKK